MVNGQYQCTTLLPSESSSKDHILTNIVFQRMPTSVTNLSRVLMLYGEKGATQTDTVGRTWITEHIVRAE